MEHFAFILSCLLAVIVYTCTAIPVLEQPYRIEAFQQDGDSQTIVLRLKPVNIERQVAESVRQSRQLEFEPEVEAQPSIPHTPNPNHFIPAVIPALTQIFQGIITGDINRIVHGSSSFAPQNVSHHIDSVYNQVVGIPPPVSTPPTTSSPQLSQVLQTTPAPIATSSLLPSSSEAELASGGSVSTSTKASNEDDEEDNEGGFGYRSLFTDRDIHKRKL